MRTSHSALVATLAAGMGLALTGCGLTAPTPQEPVPPASTQHSSAAANPAAANPAASNPAAGDSTGTSADRSHTGSANRSTKNAARDSAAHRPARVRVPAKAPRCDLRQLDLSAGREDHGAGQVYLPITVRNINASTRCRISGRIVIQLRDSAGNTVGPAVHGPARTVVLAPHRSAELVLHTTNVGIGLPCQPETRQIVITLPGHTGETQGAFDATFQACGGFTVNWLAQS